MLNRFEDDQTIEAEGPILEVMDVGFDSFLNIFFGVDLASKSVGLRPSRQARADEFADDIFPH
jgi:hypothetical protein